MSLNYLIMKKYSYKINLFDRRIILLSILMILVTAVALFSIPDKPFGSKSEVHRNAIARLLLGVTHVCSVIYLLLAITVELTKKTNMIFIIWFRG